MAIWISRNIDIWRSFKSCDSFSRRKRQNRAQKSCRQGPILSLPTTTFELHAKMVEETDLEKCNFRNFTSSVTLTLYRVEVILVRICGRGLPTHQLRLKSEKLLWTYGRTDGRMWLPIVDLLGHRLADDLEIKSIKTQTRLINSKSTHKTSNSFPAITKAMTKRWLTNWRTYWTQWEVCRSLCADTAAM